MREMSEMLRRAVETGVELGSYKAAQSAVEPSAFLVRQAIADEVLDMLAPLLDDAEIRSPQALMRVVHALSVLDEQVVEDFVEASADDQGDADEMLAGVLSILSNVRWLIQRMGRRPYQ